MSFSYTNKNSAMQIVIWRRDAVIKPTSPGTHNLISIQNHSDGLLLWHG
jgi:hypothetical protein